MAQQHRNPQEQENQQRSRWRERSYGDRNYGDRNEEDRNREWASGSRERASGPEEQGARRGGYARGGESQQSGWGWDRDTDEDRWGQGESGRYQQGQDYGRAEESYRGGQYGQREQGSYGGTSYQRGGFRGEQWRPQESGRQRQGYGGQYESQSFEQPYPPGFQSEFGSSQRATRYGSGREGNVGVGSHRGKGPKGYTRSDERLREVICEKLTDDPTIDASEINVEVTAQIVKLTGTVDDRSVKYEVEELIERCGGVKDIDNQLRVRSGAGSGAQPGSQGMSQTTSQSTREGSSGSSASKRGNS